MKTLLVIFGITGDLSTRKLLPALGHIIDTISSDDELEILGVSRRNVDINEIVYKSTNNSRLSSITSLLTMDLADLNEYKRLADEIKKRGANQTLMYLSVPPGSSAQIADLLGESGLNTPNIKLLFEKPFGFDFESAKDFINRTSRYFDESQIYRIDHYMAKNVAVKLLELRQEASSSNHQWGADTVKSVTIVASESIGIEGRAQFYEQTGALRDFIQGHLLQLLSLVLLKKPTVGAALPQKRLEALNLLQSVNPDSAVRGQYKGYQDEVGNTGSLTETFVALELKSNDPNWHNVPLRLISGKALNEKRSYIEVEYLDGRVAVIEEDSLPSTAVGRKLDAYEKVLLEAIAGRDEIFITSDEVLRSWEILSEVQSHWALDSSPIAQYNPGAHFMNIFTP